MTGADPGDPPATPIRVLIADDQALIRSGFRMILEAQPDVLVAGEAGDGAEAIAEARRLRPDVVLMDVRMPGLDGIEATRRIAGDSAIGARVLVLTMFDLDAYVYDALAAGARGFLLKDATARQLVAAVRSVAAGEEILAPAITRRLIERHLRARPAADRSPDPALLTPRERDVVGQLALGLSNGEIAVALGLSATTVKTHVANILAKLGLQDRVQVVIYAYERGIAGSGGLGGPGDASQR